MAYKSSSYSSKFPEQDDRAYNALMHDVQQKFLWHKENTSARLQKIEDMLELSVHKLSLIIQVKQESAEDGFINPSGCPKMEKQHSECKSAADNHESLLHSDLRFPKFKEGSVILETVVGIGNKKKEWPDLTEEGNGNRKELEAYQESPRYDEVPGEDKEDWHYEELICIALGLEDFFEPKQDFGEGNPIVEVLKCIPDVSIPSASKFQLPRNLNTPLDKPRLQRELNFTCLNQEVDSSDTYNKRTGVAQLHLPDEILVNYKSNYDEVRGVMQFIVADGRAETLEAKIALVSCVQTLDEDGIAGKLSQGRVELFGIDCLVDCSLKTKLFDKRLEIKSDLVAENEKENGDELLNSITSVEEAAMKLWSLMSYNFGENNVLIFDPGGYSQNGQQRGVDVTSFLRNKKVQLGEIAKITSLSSQLGQVPERINLRLLAIEQGHPQLRKAYLGRTVKQATIQSPEVHNEVDNVVDGINRKYVDHVRVKMKVLTYQYKNIVLRQCYPELNMVMRHQYLETSKRRAIRTIFDPGGDICHVAKFTRPDVLKRKELYINQKENTMMFLDPTNVLGQYLRKFVLGYTDLLKIAGGWFGIA